MIRTIFKNVYGRFVKRKVQEFNIENRAHKFLDQDKLPIAPRHFNEEKHLNQMLKDHPELKEDVNKKHEDLVDNMGKVKIIVTYPPELKSEGKKLPKERSIIPKDKNFKVHKIPPGCIDFEIFLKIYDYKYNHLWTNEEIADEFNLDINNVDDLLFYFKPYNNKVVDKKIYLQNSNHWFNRTYTKIAELMNRDVETYEEIPEYKRELARIENENKEQTELEEHKTKEQLILEESFEDFDNRMDQIKFKHLNFFVDNEREQKKENNSMDDKAKDDSKSNETSNNDKAKDDSKSNETSNNDKHKDIEKDKKNNIKKDKTSSNKKSKSNNQKKDVKINSKS